MKYALGNMLNGAGGLNADQLALDLQFAADKTLTARKGPTPTFTRASTATYFGPNAINVQFVFDGSSYNVNLSQTTILNGKYRWEGGDTSLSYFGSTWNLSQDGNAVATSASTTSWRPDDADWTGTSATVTTGNTFGIVGAAINEPRFDHDPVTLASRGLLIEESRTNLALQSENHPSATWNKTGLTVASASNTNPAGAATSNLASEDSSVGLHRLFQSTAYVSGTSYSISVFLKYAGRQFVAITHPAVAANGTAIFDIQNGTITLSQVGITSSITSYPNGWYRCVVTGVSSTTGGSSHIIQGSTTGVSLTGSYTGLNGAAFYIYGSQVEAGGFPTSYIPTTTAALARSADVCSITGANFTNLWNNNEGTVFASGDPRASASNSTYLMANSGANANQVSIFRNTTANTYGVANSGSYTAAITTSSANGSFNKIAGSYITNDARVAFNNVLGTPDTSVIVPTNLTRLNIGSSGVANSEFTNGCISAIRYYKKSLSNAKLQALTA